MVKIGDQVYYTGDRANNPAWLTVECIGSKNIGMISADGEAFNVLPSNIGDTYKGNCDPRFVTKYAYDTYRQSH